MANNIWNIDSAKENLEKLLWEAEMNLPQTIQIGSKRFRVSFIGEKDGVQASDRLAAGGPMDDDACN